MLTHLVIPGQRTTSMGNDSTAAANGGDLVEGVPLAQRAVAAEAAEVLQRLDVSPSLVRRRPGGASAYEWKFLVDELQAQQIESALRTVLVPDPHGHAGQHGGYSVTTYYFDTPNWDVLRGLGRHKLQKYRLRRYGASAEYFLERKMKHGRKVRKRRDSVTAERLGRALGREETAALDAAHWFGRQLRRFEMSPTCRVHYERRAYYGDSPEGRLRLTFDRELFAAPVDGWSLNVTREAIPLLADRVICELKYVDTMPAIFKQVIQDFQLNSGGFSKYRNGMRMLGMGQSASLGEPAAAPTGPSDA